MQICYWGISLFSLLLTIPNDIKMVYSFHMIKFLKKFLGIGESDAARRRKLYEEQLPPQSMRLPKAKLLSYIPELHPSVRRVSDKRFGCLLEWELSEGQRTAPKKSFFPKYFFRQQRTHRLVLDDFGRRTIELVNGKRSLFEIASKLRENTSYTQEQLENAIIDFFGQLVSRNAITLAPPK